MHKYIKIRNFDDYIFFEMALLEGKVALVTGGTRNIGREIALAFAAEGADLVLTCLHIGPEAKETIAKIEAMGRKVRCYVSDAADFKAAHALVDEVMEEFGHIDILVNNVGIVKDSLLLRMTEEDFDNVVRVNLKSVFNYTRAVAPYMIRARKGSIINLSSVVGVSGNAGQSNYAASKAAIIGFSKSVAKELGKKGIRSNCIAPGYINSEMTSTTMPQALRDYWVGQVAMRRGGELGEVASVALFLASDMSSYVSGQVINCCGALVC